MFMAGDEDHAHEPALAASSVGAAAATIDDGAGAAADEPIDVPPAVLTVLLVSVGVTLLWGVLPGIGGDFLTDAAATLTLLR